jgi:hypothetical protein
MATVVSDLRDSFDKVASNLSFAIIQGCLQKIHYG